MAQQVDYESDADQQFLEYCQSTGVVEVEAPKLKRGRPPGKGRVPLTKAQRREQNAHLERLRRQRDAHLWSDTKKLLGLPTESSRLKVLLRSIFAVRYERALHKKVCVQAYELRQRKSEYEQLLNQLRRDALEHEPEPNHEREPAPNHERAPEPETNHEPEPEPHHDYEHKEKKIKNKKISKRVASSKVHRVNTSSEYSCTVENNLKITIKKQSIARPRIPSRIEEEDEEEEKREEATPLPKMSFATGFFDKFTQGRDHNTLLSSLGEPYENDLEASLASTSAQHTMAVGNSSPAHFDSEYSLDSVYDLGFEPLPGPSGMQAGFPCSSMDIEDEGYDSKVSPIVSPDSDPKSLNIQETPEEKDLESPQYSEEMVVVTDFVMEVDNPETLESLDKLEDEVPVIDNRKKGTGLYERDLDMFDEAMLSEIDPSIISTLKKHHAFINNDTDFFDDLLAKGINNIIESSSMDARYGLS